MITGNHGGRPAAFAVLVLLLLSACATLPSRDAAEISRALDPSTGTRLGSALIPALAAHPGDAGIYPLAEGKGALAARLLLADVAERSLDVQYYIWHHDAAGILLLDALKRAADRGVRVRLLVDDNGVAGLDDLLAALDAHANVEVRLINPFPNRGARWLGYLTDFERLNRRMHNKSFTVDGEATIVGGRNIGDEYFAAGQEVSFADLDVLAVGPVVGEVSRSFDEYWNCAAAYPAALLLPARDATPAQVDAAAGAVRAEPRAAAYLEALTATDFVHDLLQGGLDFDWAPARLVHDDPAKLLGADTGTTGLVLSQFQDVVGTPQREFLLVSPYFVPGSRGTASLVAMAERGVAVTVLTNSLAATDVSAVHAGYARRREALLRGGVRLFELRPTAGAARQPKEPDRSGSSGASLHAKTFAVDGEQIFVGSFNFDPRSALLNTEMGLVIDSPRLAAQLARTFRDDVPSAAYEVRLDATGNLEWLGHGPGGETRDTSEPGASLMRRMTAGIAQWLPIEGML